MVLSQPKLEALLPRKRVSPFLKDFRDLIEKHGFSSIEVVNILLAYMGVITLDWLEAASEDDEEPSAQ